jgi:hypothetical protein
MIEAGRRLLRHLDTAGTVFDTAFWLLDEDVDEWRLIMASQAVRTDGPKILYHKVNQALSALDLTGILSIDMVSIVNDQFPLVERLIGVLGTASSVDGLRLDNATVDGMRLPGCLLYRLTPKQMVSVGRPETQ